MQTNLPWRVAEHSGAIYDRDGVLVCETSAEDAAAIAEAMNLRAACEVLDRQREVRTVQVATQGCSAQAERGGVWKYADGATFADALRALAGKVER